MDSIIQKPWSVQVELVEGCNRLCKFCGLNSVREKPGPPYIFMEDYVVEDVIDGIDNLCTNARIEFAMHGEPLLHPLVYHIIKKFRTAFPKTQLQLTTNGMLLLKHTNKRIKRLFEAGLDILMVDTYEPYGNKLRDLIKYKFGYVVDFYKDWAPEGLSPWTNYHRKISWTVVLMDDLDKRNGERKSRIITNQGGNNRLLPVPEGSLKKTCTIPFREISICANGDVNICCNDYIHKLVCGNVQEKTLNRIWRGNTFRAIRRHLSNKMRTFAPCSLCDIGSGSRSGLLPKYEFPSEKDKDLCGEEFERED
jgi:MoaA/NifB/PqqE/SkfB family radical SAM enzyme